MARKPLRVGLGHLFTTGQDTARDSIVHIAGAGFGAKGDPKECDWVLNPGRKISQRLYNLTGISGRESAAQPSWSKARKDISGFFAGLDVLFVCSIRRQPDWFRDVVLRGVNAPPVLVDLLEMTQFFRPEVGIPYTEGALIQMVPAKRERKGGRPLLRALDGLRLLLSRVLSALLEGNAADSDDAQFALYGLLGEALSAERAPPEFEALFGVARCAHAIRWEKGRSGLLYDRPRAMPGEDLRAYVRSWQPGARTDGQRRREAPGSAKAIKWPRVERVLEGLSTVIPGFEKRPEQVRYARFCTEAINSKGTYVAEAGTGTGKTLGYFIPACEHARLNPGLQVVIATSTKNLMGQIIDKEWKTLQSMPEAIYRDIRAALLKGKQNYLCISALRGLYGDAEYRNGDAVARLSWLYLFFVLLRGEGRWEGAPAGFEDRFKRLREFAQTVNAQEACVKGLCSMGLDCVYPRALKSAREANIVITNHHKLATLDDDFSERHSLCIIDEADLFPDNLRSSRTIDVSRVRLYRFLRHMLGTRRRRSFPQILAERVGQAKSDDKDAGLIKANLERITRYCHALNPILESIGDIGPARGHGIRWDDMHCENRRELHSALDQLRQGLETIEFLWSGIANSKRYESRSEEKKWRQRERRSVLQSQNLAQELFADMAQLVSDYPSQAYIFVYERLDWFWSIRKVPFEFSESEGPGSDFVSQLQEGGKGTVIFTSATLYVDGKLNLFCRELYHEDAAMRRFRGTTQLASPFRWQEQVGGAVAAFLPRYSFSGGKARGEDGQPTWKEEVARTIAVLSVALYGRTLVLFTNTQEMRDIYERLQPILESYDIEPLLQSGTSRSVIETFGAVEQSVLFGVNRFWTGVDFPGPTLSQVIIVRLPNPNLNDPLVKHRRQYWDRSVFWKSWYGPTTRLMLRQGFGRLIRRQSDSGVVVILDQRIVTQALMRRHAEAFPVELQCFQHSALELADWSVKRLQLGRELRARGADLEALHRKLRP